MQTSSLSISSGQKTYSNLEFIVALTGGKTGRQPTEIYDALRADGAISRVPGLHPVITAKPVEHHLRLCIRKVNNLISPMVDNIGREKELQTVQGEAIWWRAAKILGHPSSHVLCMLAARGDLKPILSPSHRWKPS